MTNQLWLSVVLLAMGLGWGLTIPLTKIAVSTGHQPMGLIFWQLVVVVVFLGTIIRLRGRRLAMNRRYLRLFLVVAMFGAVMPDIFFYLAAIHLPGGVMSITASTTVMFSLPIAIMMGNEQFELRRFAGILFGFVGILLLVGPETSLPAGTSAVFVIIALLAPMLYATEGNLVMKWGRQDLDPLQVVFGASLTGMIVAAPLAVLSGQWINPLDNFGRAEMALAAGASLHALVYATYVWLVGKAGSVFAAQSAYIVTAFGVLSSMAILGERYSLWVWTALVVMLVGMFLIQPRASRVLVPARAMGETGQDE